MMGSVMGNAQPGAGQAGGQVACPKCNAANAAGAKFCAFMRRLKWWQHRLHVLNVTLQIPAGVKFCPSCGANLQGSNCIKCNARSAPGAKFCPECGLSSRANLMSSMNCTSCGASIEIKNRFSKVFVCDYCGTHLRVKDGGLDIAGKFPKLAEFPSIFQWDQPVLFW